MDQENSFNSNNSSTFLGAIRFAKPLSTPEFFQKCVSTTQSSFIMQAWGLLQQQMAEKSTYKQVNSSFITRQTNERLELAGVPG